MVIEEEAKHSPQTQKQSPPKQAQNADSMFSPGFRSVAAMAGWDEETLLIASLVVEDTPDRESTIKKRSNLQLKSPSTNSRRKRRVERTSPVSIPVTVLNLDEDENEQQDGAESEKKKKGKKSSGKVEEKMGVDGIGSSSVVPCMDRLREELSCAICLEICFEPSTTLCGHSFCKKCLRSAADKCGKRCPKCRQLISNGRSCTVNTVLWNTIQLLFPQEVEARKAATLPNSREAKRQSPSGGSRYNARNRTILALNSPESESRSLERRRGNHNLRNRSIGTSRGDVNARRRGREVPVQDEDAALALRLQREEFMEAFRGSEEQQPRSSFTSARESLRAMASRAINIRVRGGRAT